MSNVLYTTKLCGRFGLVVVVVIVIVVILSPFPLRFQWLYSVVVCFKGKFDWLAFYLLSFILYLLFVYLLFI